MAIPPKRHQRNTVNYLDTGEVTALLAAPGSAAATTRCWC
jgi:hypothetical protein